MHRKKALFLVAFTLFSLFFGAGNLILPPQLGFKAGHSWVWVTLGFALSAVLVPIFGIWAHARLQGTLFDVAKKVSPLFSLVYCYMIYAISLSLPAPRTASVTHEMGIAPLFDSSPWLTSVFYFVLVFVFVINRSKIMDIIGKFLTPAILIILLVIILKALLGYEFDFGPSQFPHPLSTGVLEGYQTFDAIGAVVVGGVIIISVNLEFDHLDYQQKKQLIGRAGVFAGIALFLVYAGLIVTGALMQETFSEEVSRTALLTGISVNLLGNAATLFLSVLVSLACFTTAVGIVTGAADFIKGRFGNSEKAYTITAVMGCLIGMLVGQFNVGYIIAVALPALMFIYPVTIVLILLNLLPTKWATQKVFRLVVATTIVFSIPDFLGSLGWGEMLQGVTQWIPLSSFQMGWVVPALVMFLLAVWRGKRGLDDGAKVH